MGVLPGWVKRYAAGTDTRPQFTTPPDARTVEDILAALEYDVVGGQVTGNTDGYDNTITAVPVTSGNLAADDGNWSTAYDCWGPPADWFDDHTYVLIDCLWQVSWPDWSGGNSSAFFQVDFRVRNQANPSGASYSLDVYGLSQIEVRHGFGVATAFSGTVPGIAMTSGQFVEMRLNQTSGTYMATIPFRWGIRKAAQA